MANLITNLRVFLITCERIFVTHKDFYLSNSLFPSRRLWNLWLLFTFSMKNYAFNIDLNILKLSH